jgi:predicted adenylyl cyclase CyaB
VSSLREVEVKSVVDDEHLVRARLEAAGARLVFAGQLEDRRYDGPRRGLTKRDEVLRLRAYRGPGAKLRAELDWKGPTVYEQGYKVREELATGASDADALAGILARIGFVVTREIDREIVQFELDGATLRFERYPRMDMLLEIEGQPDAIERAIAATGLPRDGFTSDRLPDFVTRYEARTGERAALCARELEGDFRYGVADA